ncbi:hypothetical protein [Streptomyces sp. NBC_00878]|uniref:hypothetical protein n=1 Tax=Streptomyces sp. NBC_00878 TaxID=2975854 RepID=UPI002259C150|nr:hypothetical protein [Streptomyces sp. NBC_00878]MCX4902880.1 hypothetical protein [Streptomyces sp. NBC_00878]
MIPRYFDGLNRFERAFVVVVACLAVLGIGRAFWPEADEDNGPAPGTTATAERLPVEVGAAEPELMDTDTSRSEMGLPPKPGSDAPFTERVLGEVQEKTLLMAGIRAKVSAGCEGGQVMVKTGQKTVCTVTYRGVKLPWDVWVEDVAGGGPVQLIHYQIYPPDSGVLLAKTVYGRYWELRHKSAKEMRCDRIPSLKTVTVDDDTGYECQYLDTGGDAPRWVNEKVFLAQGGPSFREIE